MRASNSLKGQGLILHHKAKNHSRGLLVECVRVYQAPPAPLLVHRFLTPRATIDKGTSVLHPWSTQWSHLPVTERNAWLTILMRTANSK